MLIRYSFGSRLGGREFDQITPLQEILEKITHLGDAPMPCPKVGCARYVTGQEGENLTGSKANDRLTGSSATNVLVGGSGADALFGLGGPDTLNSRDTVNGNDTLDGGAGTDNCIKDATEKSVKNCP